MRSILIFSLSLMAFAAVADDRLWEKLLRDPYMVVLMRNSESSGNRDVPVCLYGMRPETAEARAA